MSKNVDLIPNIKFPLGKSSRMLDGKHTRARVFSAAPFSKPKGGNHHSGYFLPADKWTDKRGPSTLWDVILPQEGARRWHRLQCGRALETRDRRPRGRRQGGGLGLARGRWPLQAHSSLGGRGGCLGTRRRWWQHGIMNVLKATVWLTLKQWTVNLPNVTATKNEGRSPQRPWVGKLTKNYENSQGRGSAARQGLRAPELGAQVQVQTLPGTLQPSRPVPGRRDEPCGPSCLRLSCECEWSEYTWTHALLIYVNTKRSCRNAHAATHGAVRAMVFRGRTLTSHWCAGGFPARKAAFFWGGDLQKPLQWPLPRALPWTQTTFVFEWHKGEEGVSRSVTSDSVGPHRL